MIPVVLLYLLGILAWILPTAAAIWYLLAFREMQQEVKTIRRYLQEMHDRSVQGRSP